MKHSSLTAWPLNMGPIGCSETSVQNYHPTLRKIPKESNVIYTAAEAWNHAYGGFFHNFLYGHHVSPEFKVKPEYKGIPLSNLGI